MEKIILVLSNDSRIFSIVPSIKLSPTNGVENCD